MILIVTILCTAEFSMPTLEVYTLWSGEITTDEDYIAEKIDKDTPEKEVSVLIEEESKKLNGKQRFSLTSDNTLNPSSLK